MLLVLIGIALALGEQFVQVKDDSFALAGKKIKVVGTNNYYMTYMPLFMVDDVFERAQFMHLFAIRIQGYLDGVTANGISMQPYLGEYDETGFTRLDYIVCTAQKYNIRLVINLVNNWEAFGGMGQYVTWINQKLSTHLTHDDFYTNTFIKTYFMKYIYHMLTRNNTCNGLQYKEDPTIMAWQLANEPRAQTDKSAKIVTSWAKEISEFIKSIDANHLISIGNEGFLCEPGHKSWMYDCSQGTNSIDLAGISTIDYITMHFYPDNWNLNSIESYYFVDKNIDISKQFQKPMIIEEFGDKKSKAVKYQEWTEYFEANDIAGDMFWMLCGVDEDYVPYPNYDGYCLYYPSNESEIIMKHAEGSIDSGSWAYGCAGLLMLLVLL